MSADEKLERDHAEALHMDACYTPRDVMRVTIEAPAAIEQNEIVQIAPHRDRPTDLEMVDVLVKHYKVSAQVVIDWLHTMNVPGAERDLRN